jgi:C4-dicarboxylate-specific signal transduction histidine kinase
MSTLVISSDDDAVEALCSALRRQRMTVHHALDLDTARERLERLSPRTIVCDTALAGYELLLEEARRVAPWIRSILMVDPYGGVPEKDAIAVSKPFDASELALSIARQHELAELDFGRHNLERELEHAERLAAIGRLAASMAHEINNPLAVIFATTTYVAEAAERIGDPDLLDCARDLELAGERIASFVQHVCGFARRERPQLVDVPLQAAVEVALRLVRPRAKDRNVQVVLEPSPALRAPHDPPRLAQAVLNLLANAIDAMAGRDGKVVIGLREEPGRAVIWVDDDGPGIHAAIADKLFQPFATTKPHGQGTGLGLALTRQILQDHGGAASLSPRSCGGTRAELHLPSAKSAREAPEHAA